MLKKLRLNGAESLARALVEGGVQVVFGLPGVHNLALFEALRRSGLRVVPATHEQGAAFMAYGYGRATGRPGVFVTVPGPGLTNSMTPIAEALVDSTPMLGIVTDVPRSSKKFQMHEIDQTRLAQPIAKSVQTAGSASDIAPFLKRMLKLTTSGEPGPCILQIPSDLFWEKSDRSDSREAKAVPPAVSSQEMEKVVSRLQSTGRVGLFVGLGAADASAEVRELAEVLNAPVATTGSGRGVMDEAHPLSLGFAWKSGSIDSVNRIFATCNLVLAIGVKFSQNGTQDFHLKIPCPLIHVDASPEVIGKNYKAEIALVADARDFLKTVLAQKSSLNKKRDDGLLELIRAEKEICDARLAKDDSTRLFLGDETFSPMSFFAVLRELLPPNAILVTDAGYNERLTIQHWLAHEPRTLINPCNFESMGFAIPTAIGASFAFPDRKVVAIAGDGGLTMSGLEMMTAVRERRNLTVIVLNNHGFGIIKKIQQDFFGASVAVDVGAPDFKLLAESVGMRFQPVTGGLSVVGEALEADGPVLLDIRMKHKDEMTAGQRRQRLKNDVKQGLQKLLP